MTRVNDFETICPRCGADRGGLLGVAHDFINDCPQCRSGPTGPTHIDTPPYVPPWAKPRRTRRSPPPKAPR